jgi:hypothetical protein
MLEAGPRASKSASSSHPVVRNIPRRNWAEPHRDFARMPMAMARGQINRRASNSCPVHIPEEHIPDTEAEAEHIPAEDRAPNKIQTEDRGRHSRAGAEEGGEAEYI